MSEKPKDEEAQPEEEEDEEELLGSWLLPFFSEFMGPDLEEDEPEEDAENGGD